MSSGGNRDRCGWCEWGVSAGLTETRSELVLVDAPDGSLSRRRNVTVPFDEDRFERGEERYSIENEIVHILHEHSEQAYDVHEVTVEVVESGWSEANVDSSDAGATIGCVLDLATVSSILDSLVDDGHLHRRIVDVGDGERSYYRAPSAPTGVGLE